MIVDADGQVNYQALFLGMPKAGKSTLMRAVARRALVEDRAIVVVHDPEGEWSRKWPGCVTVETSRHARVMLENLRAPPKGWRATHAPGPLPMLGRVIACRLEASEVAAFVMTLGKMVNTAERVTVPILVLFDEGAYLDDSSSTHQGDGDKKLTAVRRHRGIAVGWNVQSPATLPVPFWRLATDVYIVSALPSYEDARAAEKHCGLDRGALEFARRLERYQIVRIHRGRGIVPLWSQQ